VPGGEPPNLPAVHPAVPLGPGIGGEGAYLDGDSLRVHAGSTASTGQFVWYGGPLQQMRTIDLKVACL